MPPRLKKIVNSAIGVVCVLMLAGVFLLSCVRLKEAGRTIGHTTRDVTREIGHGTRDVVRGVGEGARDATNGAAEEVKKVVKPTPEGSEY